jgi:carbonic anhydrase
MWNYQFMSTGQIYPYNFIGYNPPTSTNPYQKFPQIDPSAFLSPFTFIIGDITIQNNVYIAPFVSIRADEGSPFFIGSNSNLQDGVILHGLKKQYMTVNNRSYSIYIGKKVTCAHNSIVHGPCLIKDDVFVGFQSTVYNAYIGEGTFISSGAVITNGVTLRPNSFVPPGASIDSQEKADKLPSVPIDKEEFAKSIQKVNQEFPTSYSLLFGENRCSCGVAW